MRKFTLAELLERSGQATRATAERIPCVRQWVLPDARSCFSAGTAQPVAFARLVHLLPTSLGPGVQPDRSAPTSRNGKALQRWADEALEGRFDLLGYRALDFGRPIDWHLEPTSGKRSPRVHWKRLASLDASKTGDKKVVWELNRHRHLLAYARAFRQTGDEKYAEALLDDVRTWIRDNPTAVGINWVSSLDIAFRCINWLWSIASIQGMHRWPSSQVLDLKRALYVQGRHIECYLSTYYSPNTHLTGEALGLYYLGSCLPELECAGRWRELGRSILLRQLETQVRPDGVYFEQSTRYQRYTADFYLHFIILAGRSGDALPARVSERLQALLDYLMWITRPDGTSPYIGDDDGGTLLKIDDCPPNDWRAVLSSGAVMFGRGDYKHVAGSCAEETCLLLGSDAKERFDRIPSGPPEITSRAFSHGGFYVMRSGWAADSNYLLVDCGPHGTMNCGHAHADALAIEVAAMGTTFLVDTGTFTYTGSAEFRDLFRSTAMHNCLAIDGLSSSVPAGPFKWKHVANCTTHCWHDHPDFTFFEGSHDGYGRLQDPATHARAVFFVNREYWLMLDRVQAEGDHVCEAHFHLAPGIAATLHHETERLEAHAASTTLDIIYPEMRGAWKVADGLVSPCYGAKVMAPHGTYSVHTTGPAALLSVLFPRSSVQPSPGIRNLDPERGKGIVVATPRFRDLLIWSGKAFAAEGVHSTDFEWVWMRHSTADGVLERAALLHGSGISSDAVELKTERPVQFIAIAVKDKICSVDIFPSVGIRFRPSFDVRSVVVNGRTHEACPGEALDVPEHDVPALAVPRDPTALCSHVRH